MMTLKRLTLFLLLTWSIGAQGQQATGSEALTSTFNEMDPRVAGMAGAGMASARNTAYSAFLNSAVLPFHDGKWDAEASYVSHLRIYGTGSAGVAWRISDRIGISLSGGYDGGPAYDVIPTGLEETVQPETFLPTALRIGLGAGVRVWEGLSIGLAVRTVSETLAKNAVYKGFAGDFSVFYKVQDGLAFTGGVRNIGTKVEDASGHLFAQPMLLFAGGEWIPLQGLHTLRTNLDLHYAPSPTLGVNLGLEYGYNDMFFARAGYRYATWNGLRPGHGGSLGFGARIKAVRMDISLMLDQCTGVGLAFGIGLNI